MFAFDMYDLVERVGRTRLEPVAIVILAVIMCAASVLVMYESINVITDDIKYFTETNTTRTLPEIDMSAFPIATCVVTIVSKAVLFFLCNRIDTPTMSALATDHRNDVASNIVALSCGLIGITRKEGEIFAAQSSRCFVQVRLPIDKRSIRRPLSSILSVPFSSPSTSSSCGFDKAMVCFQCHLHSIDAQLLL